MNEICQLNSNWANHDNSKGIPIEETPKETKDDVNSSPTQTVESHLDESETDAKLKSATFNLHSVRDYKSVFQEDL